MNELEALRCPGEEEIVSQDGRFNSGCIFSLPVTCQPHKRVSQLLRIIQSRSPSLSSFLPHFLLSPPFLLALLLRRSLTSTGTGG